MPPKSTESSFSDFLDTYAEENQPWVKEKQKRGKMLPYDNESSLVIAQRVSDSIYKKGTVSPKGFIGNALETADKIGMFTRIAAATGLQVDAMLGESEIDETITITATI